MSEQLSLFEMGKDWKDVVSETLERIIREKRLPAKSLHLYANKSRTGKITSWSVCIYEPDYPDASKGLMEPGRNSVILRMKETGKDQIEMISAGSQAEDIALPSDASLKSTAEDGNSHILMRRNSADLSSYIEANVEYSLANYVSKASRFACCSRFTECSDAKACVHENQLYAKACMYRMNLESGRIYYGRNKNIDENGNLIADSE